MELYELSSPMHADCEPRPPWTGQKDVDASVDLLSARPWRIIAGIILSIIEASSIQHNRQLEEHNSANRANKGVS